MRPPCPLDSCACLPFVRSRFAWRAGVKTQITDISGSVEAAVGLGLADAVVDLVETGTTMRAAGLCVAENLMQTQVCMRAAARSACARPCALRGRRR